MALRRHFLGLLISIITSLLVYASNGAVYKVADSAGWTTIGNVDYKEWASDKIFHVGDIIVFEYNPIFHNVVRVSHAGYKACNTSSPISTHSSGNDSIVIATEGHHFFICSVPGHCQAGQKVDINVLRAPSVTPTPLGPASEEASVPPAQAPAPANSSDRAVAAVRFGGSSWFMMTIIIIIIMGM